MRYLLSCKFSFLDIIWILTFSNLLNKQQFILAGIVILVGPSIVILLEIYYRKVDQNKRDEGLRVWQAYADHGYKSDAITAYACWHNCSIEEAIVAVNKYRDSKS